MSGVPADDRGLSLGVGLFETILAVDGGLALWDAHMDRLERGCGVLALPLPDRATCLELAHDALQRAGLETGRAAVRLTWTGGSGARGLAAPSPAEPRLLVAAAPSAPPPTSLALHTSTIRRNASSPTARLKTLSYLDSVLARAEATAAGADEALLLDQAGSVACAAAANIFWLEGSALCTPALSCGVLDGVVRAVAIYVAAELGMDVKEVSAPPARLFGADSVFITNSLQGCVAVHRIDGWSFSRETSRLLEVFRCIQKKMFEISFHR
jgi:branched-subunit amino acid aminotransferase/4-amino-4-deoxychorismate lyase